MSRNKESFYSNMKTFFLSNAWVLSMFARNTKELKQTSTTTYFLIFLAR